MVDGVRTSWRNSPEPRQILHCSTISRLVTGFRSLLVAVSIDPTLRISQPASLSDHCCREPRQG